MEEADENLAFPHRLFKQFSGSTGQQVESLPNSPPTPKFEDGKVLPRQFLTQLLQEAKPCVPLDEIDPYYRHLQTFVAIGRWGTIHRFSFNSKNHLTLDPNNALRRAAIYLQSCWVYSTFIVATVLINIAALLTTQSYEIMQEIDANYPKTGIVDAMYIVNDVCLAVYCFDLLVKIFARGLLAGPFTCCQDPWSWLDLLIILIGFIPANPIILTRGAAVWIRIFKIIPLIPAIRQAGRIAKAAVNRLSGMLLLNAILLWFFALMGCQVYMGTLSQICILKLTGDGPITDKIWNDHYSNKANWHKDSAFMRCGNMTGAGQCPEDYICLQGFGQNPDSGYTNFDTVLWSLLSVIRIAAEDFTEEIYRNILSTNGPWHMIYFLLIFFLVTYPMGCLFFAILGSIFTEKMDNGEETDGLTQGVSSGEIRTIQGNIGDDDYSGEDLVGIRRTLHSWVYYEWSRNFLICVILIDIFAITSYYDGIDDDVVDTWLYTVVIPYTVLIVYTAELILKMVIWGPVKYFRRGWNILDFVILVQFNMSVFYLLLEKIGDIGHYTEPIRFLKLIHYWPSLRMIFGVYFKAIKNLWGWILYSGIIFAFFTFITPFELGQYERHAEIGRKDLSTDDIPRWSFVDFWRSFRLIVRMQIAEWVETLWEILPYAGSITFVYYLAVNLCGALLISFVMIGVVHSCVGELQNNYDPGMEKGLRLLFRKAADCIPRLQAGKRNGFGTLAGEGGHQQTGHLRKRMQDFAEHWVYKMGFVLIILVAVINMTFETKEDNSKNTAQLIIEIVFTVAVLILAGFECLAYGMSESILNRGWLLDVLIVFENILNLSIHRYTSASPFLVAMLWIRACRPLMLIHRLDWLKAPFRGLKYELKIIWETILGIFFIWLIFDTFAVHWLAGLYHKCVEDATGEKMKLNRTDCLKQNYTWENTEFHFDNAFDGFINMVFLVSRMGWVSIINGGSDATDHGMSPEKDINKMWLVYFIIFMFTGGIGAMGILFAYIFNKFRQDRGYTLILTEKQAQKYTESKSEKWIVSEYEYIPAPTSSCRLSVYNFVSNWKFDCGVMLVILIDNFCLSLDHYGANTSFTMVMFHLALILTLYTIEMILKMIGWGRFYFKSGWNILDMIIVITGIMDLFMSEFSSKYLVSASLLRMMRLLRLFRFLLNDRWGCKAAKYFLGALGNAKYALGNLLFLQVIIMWAFALLGMYLFGNIKESWAIDAYVNFKTVPSAFATLALLFGFPCLDGFYLNLSNTKDCSVEKETCGSTARAVFYIGLYAGLTFLILLNMYAVFITEILLQIGGDQESKEEEVRTTAGDVQNIGEVKTDNGEERNNGEFSQIVDDPDTEPE